MILQISRCPVPHVLGICSFAQAGLSPPPCTVGTRVLRSIRWHGRVVPHGAGCGAKIPIGGTYHTEFQGYVREYIWYMAIYIYYGYIYILYSASILG
jgi:hypothetical protein